VLSVYTFILLFHRFFTTFNFVRCCDLLCHANYVLAIISALFHRSLLPLPTTATHAPAKFSEIALPLFNSLNPRIWLKLLILFLNIALSNFDRKPSSHRSSSRLCRSHRAYRAVDRRGGARCDAAEVAAMVGDPAELAAMVGDPAAELAAMDHAGLLLIMVGDHNASGASVCQHSTSPATQPPPPSAGRATTALRQSDAAAPPRLLGEWEHSQNQGRPDG
jgi:hypothetical protein